METSYEIQTEGDQTRVVKSGEIIGYYRAGVKDGFTFVFDLVCNHDPVALSMLVNEALRLPRPFYAWVECDNPNFDRLLNFYRRIGGKDKMFYLEFK